MGLFAATAARSSPRLLLAGALARVRAQARSLSASAQPAMPLGASWRADYLSAPAVVVVFHKTHCSLCRDLVERLEDALDAKSVREVALDKLPNRGDALREVLRNETGQQHVPYVFIGGVHVKTEDAVSGLRRAAGGQPDECALAPKLRAAGAVVTGQFRS